MTPNQLFQAFADVVTDVCKRPFREEPLTLDEWKAIDDRWLTLKQMNLRALALRPEHEKAKGEDNGGANNRSKD